MPMTLLVQISVEFYQQFSLFQPNSEQSATSLFCKHALLPGRAAAGRNFRRFPVAHTYSAA
jgi:hypothetical protein